MKKFELSNESICHFGKTLYRIKALKDFSNVKKGDLGGFVEKEENLSQEGDCWIYGNAKALDDSRISGNVRIFDNVIISNDVRISGNVRISDNVRIFGNVRICDNVLISGNVLIFDNVRISDNVIISNDVRISDNALICDDVRIFGNALISGNGLTSDNALIKSNNDWISIDSIGSEYGTLTAYKLNNGDIGVTRCCFSGTLEEFTNLVNEGHNDNEHREIYRSVIALIETKFK